MLLAFAVTALRREVVLLDGIPFDGIPFGGIPFGGILLRRCARGPAGR